MQGILARHFPPKAGKIDPDYEDSPLTPDRKLSSISYDQTELNIQPRDLNPVQTPGLNMLDPSIHKGFPFWDRVGISCTGFTKFCVRSDESYIQSTYTSELMKGQSQGINERYMPVLQNFRNKVVYLKIHDTNGLELDPHIIHPFVKIHFIDLNTHQYLKKPNPRNALSYFENMVQMNNGNPGYFTGNCDLVYPFSTQPYDMRITGECDPHWNSEFMIDQDAGMLLNSDTVILFEILDFNFKLIKENSKLLRSDNMYPVAWAFLRPVGNSKLHLGINKLQLYRYKYKPPPGFSEFRRPHVYYDFQWYKKELYPSFLRVELRVIEAPRPKVVYGIALNPFEKEVSKKDFEELEREAGKPRKLKLGGKEEIDAEALERAKRLMKLRRLYQEECRIPNKLLYKLPSSKLGCWRLTFSHSGVYLAAACTDDDETVIKIFQVEDGDLALTLRGHADLVHDLRWSDDDMYIVSCSSDGTAKVWDFTSVFRGGGDAMGFTQTNFNPGTAGFLSVSLQHPSYVYCSQYHPDQNYTHSLFIVTACYDGRIRFWHVSKQGEVLERIGERSSRLVEGPRPTGTLLDEIDILPQKDLSYSSLKESDSKTLFEHRHPNYLEFDNQCQLYVGDSLGMISIFNVQIRGESLEPVLVRQMNLTELSNDAINTILLQPPDKRLMIVQCRDNVLRRIEPARVATTDETDLIDTRFFGAQFSRYAIRACVSPDGNYVLSGSEDGKAYMWNIATSYLEDIEDWELNVRDIVCDVAWSNTYNMVAVACFGSELPILVYCYEKTPDEVGVGLANVEMSKAEMLAPQKEMKSDMAYDVLEKRTLSKI